MNILEKIVEANREALTKKKRERPLSALMSEARAAGDPAPFRSAVCVKGELSVIAAILEQSLLVELLDLSREIGLGALVEAHDETEVERALKAGSDLIGINNRNLKDLSVNLETTFRLKKLIPEGICVVSESGISEPEQISRLRRAWVQAALIGESVLKSADPHAKLKGLVTAGKQAQEAGLN